MSVDPSQIVNGGIYKVKDSDIDFPDTPNAKKKAFRSILILSSDTFCQSDESVISIAPLSSEFSTIHDTDEFLDPDRENQLLKKSRVLLGHIQTIRKQVLITRYGRVGDADWRRIMAKIVDNFDR